MNKFFLILGVSWLLLALAVYQYGLGAILTTGFIGCTFLVVGVSGGDPS
jgi:hypothetical protein